MILCNYLINTITIINCEWNDWMVLSYKPVYKHVTVIKRCTNNGDCPRDKPIGLNRFCIGNKEYRKYTYTKTVDNISIITVSIFKTYNFPILEFDHDHLLGSWTVQVNGEEHGTVTCTTTSSIVTTSE